MCNSALVYTPGFPASIYRSDLNDSDRFVINGFDDMVKRIGMIVSDAGDINPSVGIPGLVNGPYSACIFHELVAGVN